MNSDDVFKVFYTLPRYSDDVFKVLKYFKHYRDTGMERYPTYPSYTIYPPPYPPVYFIL